MEGVYTAEAVIDNGPFGNVTIKFETGRLARLAAGSAVVYLDGETMVLSATTAGKHPKEGLDFFPLTVDVEERMYAAGRIPGSFFRREGRPSEDAILTCRLIDRPLRPSFVKGLRNEVQIVETILALHPEHLYDVVAINAASLSTQLSGLPFSGPIGGVRVALIKGQWVGFPTHTAARGRDLRHGGRRPGARGRRRRDHDGRGRVHAAHPVLLADADSGAVAPDRGDGRPGPGGGEAVHHGAVRGPAEHRRRGRQADRASSRSSPTTRRRRPRRRRRRGLRRAGPALDHRGQAGARDRDRPDQGADAARSSPASSRAGRRRSARRSAR